MESMQRRNLTSSNRTTTRQVDHHTWSKPQKKNVRVIRTYENNMSHGSMSAQLTVLGIVTALQTSCRCSNYFFLRSSLLELLWGHRPTINIQRNATDQISKQLWGHRPIQINLAATLYRATGRQTKMSSSKCCMPLFGKNRLR